MCVLLLVGSVASAGPKRKTGVGCAALLNALVATSVFALVTVGVDAYSDWDLPRAMASPDALPDVCHAHQRNAKLFPVGGESACGPAAGAMGLSGLAAIGYPKLVGTLSQAELTKELDESMRGDPNWGTRVPGFLRGIGARLEAAGYDPESITPSHWSGWRGKPPDLLKDLEVLRGGRGALWLLLDWAQADDKGIYDARESGGHYVLVTGFRRKKLLGRDVVEIAVRDPEEKVGPRWVPLIPAHGRVLTPDNELKSLDGYFQVDGGLVENTLRLSLPPPKR